MRVVDVDVVVVRVGRLLHKGLVDAGGPHGHVILRLLKARRVGPRGQAFPVDDDVRGHRDARRLQAGVHLTPVKQGVLHVDVVDKVGAAEGGVLLGLCDRGWGWGVGGGGLDGETGKMRDRKGQES